MAAPNPLRDDICPECHDAPAFARCPECGMIPAGLMADLCREPLRQLAKDMCDAKLPDELKRTGTGGYWL